MVEITRVECVLVDEVSLTVEELARAVAVHPGWVVERVEAGLLRTPGGETLSWRFASADLVRARRLLSLERHMDANPELAALVADLIEELQALRRQLRAAGSTPR